MASIYNPINEIGFLAWTMAGSHIMGGECTDRDGYSVKSRLVQAALRGIDAISAADSGAKFMHIEPLIHVVAPADQPAMAQAAADFCGYQWQVWDMLSGRIAPEIGGTLAAIDWIGVNHHHDAQWEIGTGQRLDWHTSDPRRPVALARPHCSANAAGDATRGARRGHLPVPGRGPAGLEQPDALAPQRPVGRDCARRR